MTMDHTLHHQLRYHRFSSHMSQIVFQIRDSIPNSACLKVISDRPPPPQLKLSPFSQCKL